MKLRKLNKKADIPSLIIVGVILIFVYIVISVAFAKGFTDTLETLKNSGKFSSRSIETMNYVQQRTIPYLDYFIFFSLIGAIIGLIVSSIYIDAHPSIMMIFIVMLIVTIILAGYLVNAYDDFRKDAEITSTANQFRLTNIIFSQYFPGIIFVVGIIVIIILYSKSRYAP
jgi:hypothetical protein